ncbi:MAG: carboxypeptidase-like regulatory domain-containing protein [Flavobacterium sp.]
MHRTKWVYLLLIFLYYHAVSSQSLTGVVQDTLGKPLPNANVIAKPATEGASLKFAIADFKGRYKLELEKNTNYQIRVSYIGHQEHVLNYQANSNLSNYNFVLKQTGEQLKEVIITHKYEPIVVKKDTVTFKVDAFASGNERKLKEQLEKLPGVEVGKDGSVTYQGKRVSTLMVENKPFFGGGTKLGVENIPADAVNKVEFLDHFNEVGFLKQVSDSDKLVMNIQLKEDKKKFVFGDLSAAYGPKDYYLGHAALFYYSPKLNVGYIADANNYGERVFSFEDLMRFQGGVSSFLNQRKQLTNLYNFSMENNDVRQTKSHFHALNLNYTFNPKLDLQGFVLFSDTKQATQNSTNLQYLQTNTQENRNSFGNQKTTLGMTNWKLDFSPNKNTKWFYNIHAEAAANQNETNLFSQIFAQNATQFNFWNQTDHASIKQYIERHQYHNKKNTTTLVINHTYTNEKPENTWLTNQTFLPGLLPLQNDSFYKVMQMKQQQTNVVDALFKHYYLWNNYHHIYTILGINSEQTHVNTSEEQLLTNGQSISFENEGFGNDLFYRFNDYYLGLEYKFKIGNWINKPMIYQHFYELKTQNISNNQKFTPYFLEPQWLSEFDPNSSEKITFHYKLTNQFPNANQMANQFTLQSFNAVFKGNALLQNERFHHLNFRYNKNNMYTGWMLFANASYSRKNNTIRNVIALQGIDQFTTPLQTNNPETNWNLNWQVSKKIYRFNLRFHASFSGFEYLQEINGLEALNQRNNQRVGITLRTAYKKWPSVSVAYSHGFSQFKGVQTNRFENQSFDTNFDYEVFKHLVFKTNYQWNNALFASGNNIIQVWNASLFYQKKNHPFGFELKANNLLNVDRRFQNSFSDFLISEQEVFVLPRIILFGLHYKI